MTDPTPQSFRTVADSLAQDAADLRARALESVERFQETAIRWSSRPNEKLVNAAVSSHYLLNLDADDAMALIFIRTDELGPFYAELVKRAPSGAVTSEMFGELLNRVPDFARTQIMQTFFYWMIDMAMKNLGEKPDAIRDLVANARSAMAQIQELAKMFAPPTAVTEAVPQPN